MNWLYLIYSLAGFFVGFSVACIWLGYRDLRQKDIEFQRFYPIDAEKVGNAILDHGRFVLGDEEYDLGDDQY